MKINYKLKLFLKFDLKELNDMKLFLNKVNNLRL